jgi:hypothetical protein
VLGWLGKGEVIRLAPMPGVPRREIGLLPKSGVSFHWPTFAAFLAAGGGADGDAVKFRGGGGID